MTISARLILAVSASVLLAACEDRPTSGGILATTGSAAALSAGEHAAVDDWLHCIECVDGELDSLRALGARKPVALAARLRGDLLGGPSTARVANVRAQAAEAYAMVRGAGLEDSSLAVAVTEPEYIAHFVRNYRTLYGLRSARAIAVTNGPGARAALDSAAKGMFRRGADLLPHVAMLAAAFARDSLLAPGAAASPR